MMTLPKIVSFIFFCSMFITTQGQDLPKHLWKNRILLVLTGDTLSPDYTKQLEEIRTDPEGVVERKLIVYLVTPFSYKEGISNGPWIQSPKLYKRFHQPGNPLEVVLIGLDGSVKHQTQSLTPLIQVFAWIDSMPMRSQEIRRKQATGN